MHILTPFEWHQIPKQKRVDLDFSRWNFGLTLRTYDSFIHYTSPVLTGALEEMRMSVVERAAEWPKQWLREGREQGIEQGVDQQRALLCRMAAARFGADTAARLADVLAPIVDPERLAEIGEWLGSCDTAAVFLARLDPGSPSR